MPILCLGTEEMVRVKEESRVVKDAAWKRLD